MTGRALLVWRQVRRWYRRLRWGGYDRIPIRYRHPIDQLVFYIDVIGSRPMPIERERALRAHCDQEVSP